MENQLSPELVGLHENRLLPYYKVEDSKLQHGGVQCTQDVSAGNPTATEHLSISHEFSEAVPELQVNGEKTHPYDVAYNPSISHMVCVIFYTQKLVAY